MKNRARAPGVGRRRGRGGRVLIGSLVAAFVVLGGLFIQSALALRAHQVMVDATLRDFTGFAAERIATELDQFFIGTFLDQLARARSAHDAWTESGGTLSTIPEDDPDPAFPVFFSLVDDELVVHGPVVASETSEWVHEQVRRHLPGYPGPAPYVVLRDDRSLAVVYRRESGYGADHVYGFVLDLSEFGRLYARIVEQTPLLARSLGDTASDRELFSVGVYLAPTAEPLYSRDPRSVGAGPEEWAFAAKAARLAVRVRIDADEARSLLAGATPASSLPILTALGVLTVLLLYGAVWTAGRVMAAADARETFIANISHDLRTPITQIRMFSETLLLGRLTAEAERQRALGVIGRQAEVLDDLVDNLFSAAGKRPPLEPVPSDLDGLLEDVIDAQRPAAERLGATLDGKLVGDVTATVDPMVVRRILTNLVDNAILHAGGDRIDVEIDHGADVTLSVRDRGPGIPRKEWKRVFERFERIESRPGEATGAGLGLCVVRDLARRHGGDAWIEAAPGGGMRAVARLSTADANGSPGHRYRQDVG